jgi:hypothetical protein
MRVDQRDALLVSAARRGDAGHKYAAFDEYGELFRTELETYSLGRDAARGRSGSTRGDGHRHRRVLG